MDPALLPALHGTEAQFGTSTQFSRTGVRQSKSKQEALGHSTQGSCAWCRNPEDPQAQGKRGQQQHREEGWRGRVELGSPSLSWRALRHWMKVKADTCPSTFLLSFLRLCLSPEIMQQQAAQKWEQHKGLLWHIDPLLYIPCPQARPQGNIQNPAGLGVTAGLCPRQGLLSRQSKRIFLPGGGITRRH